MPCSSAELFLPLTFTVLLIFLNILRKEESPAFLGKHFEIHSTMDAPVPQTHPKEDHFLLLFTYFFSFIKNDMLASGTLSTCLWRYT